MGVKPLDISFTSVAANIQDRNGVGVAGMGVCQSLQNLGHNVKFQDPDCPIEIAFVQPVHDVWSSDPGRQHRIIYTPWESTELPKGWKEGFAKADEVWATSYKVKEWYEGAGIKVDNVYQHGIAPEWVENRARRRRTDRPLRVGYFGSPAVRKGGQLAYDAFQKAFGRNPMYQFIIKAQEFCEIRHKVDGKIVGPAGMLNENVQVIVESMPFEQLINLYKSIDVMVMPSSGEGWGLIPFQSMALGIPTITTGATTDYEDLIVPELNIPATMIDSPWPKMHPGRVYKPDFDSIVDSLKWVDKNYDQAAGVAYRNSFKLAEQYNWEKLTETAFKKFL